jgi:hypothetical protein
MDVSSLCENEYFVHVLYYFTPMRVCSMVGVVMLLLDSSPLQYYCFATFQNVIHSSLGVMGTWFQYPSSLWIPKSEDAQVP